MSNDKVFENPLHYLRNVQSKYIKERNTILDSWWKPYFYKSHLKDIDIILSSVELKIYNIESKETKELLEKAENKLKENQPQ